MSKEIEDVRNHLTSIAGTALSEEDLLRLLKEVVASGGGVTLEADLARFKLVQREGRFVLKRDDSRPSTMPPRR